MLGQGSSYAGQAVRGRNYERNKASCAQYEGVCPSAAAAAARQLSPPSRLSQAAPERLHLHLQDPQISPERLLTDRSSCETGGKQFGAGGRVRDDARFVGSCRPQEQVFTARLRLTLFYPPDIAYLESQLERVSAACLTVQTYDERLEAAVAASRTLEDRVVSLARLVSVTQQYAEQQERTARESLEEVRQRLSSLEASLAELTAPPKSREWEARLAAAAARVDAKLAELDAAAEARLREASAALESGLAERCHAAHVDLREAGSAAASRLTEVERRLRSLDEFARSLNAAQQVDALAARVGGLEDSVRVLTASDAGVAGRLSSLELATSQLRAALVALEVQGGGEAAPRDWLASAKAALMREVAVLEQQKHELAAGLGSVAAAATAPPPSPAKAAVGTVATQLQTAVAAGMGQEVQALQAAGRWLEGVASALPPAGNSPGRQQPVAKQPTSSDSTAADWSIAAIPSPGTQQQQQAVALAAEDALVALYRVLGSRGASSSTAEPAASSNGLQGTFAEMTRALEAVKSLLQEERATAADAVPTGEWCAKPCSLYTLVPA